MNDADFVKIAKALADPTRRRIVESLRGRGELICTEVCACFDLSQPTISHHIRALRNAGIVEMREEGTFNILTVREDVLGEFSRAVSGAPAPTPARRRTRPASRSGRKSSK